MQIVKVYLSAPYTAPTPTGIDLNIANARRVAIDLWNDGFAVYCPHMNTAHFEHLLTRELIMQGDLAILKGMDAMLLQGNWQNSNGCQEEIEVANNNKIPIFESIKQLKQWRNNQQKHLKTVT